MTFPSRNSSTAMPTTTSTMAQIMIMDTMKQTMYMSGRSDTAAGNKTCSMLVVMTTPGERRCRRIAILTTMTRFIAEPNMLAQYTHTKKLVTLPNILTLFTKESMMWDLLRRITSVPMHL